LPAVADAVAVLIDEPVVIAILVPGPATHALALSLARSRVLGRPGGDCGLGIVGPCGSFAGADLFVLIGLIGIGGFLFGPIGRFCFFCDLLRLRYAFRLFSLRDEGSGNPQA
jgi:hypothetical protein